MIRSALAVLSLWVAGAGAASAHHSYSMFDIAELPVSGTIVRVNWANPHAWVYIKTEGPEGAEWALELRSISELARQGMRSIDLKPGEKLAGVMRTARDGSKMGTIIRATTASGKRFGRTREEATSVLPK